jgi:hypothetical protein
MTNLNRISTVVSPECECCTYNLETVYHSCDDARTTVDNEGECSKGNGCGDGRRQKGRRENSRCGKKCSSTVDISKRNEASRYARRKMRTTKADNALNNMMFSFQGVDDLGYRCFPVGYLLEPGRDQRSLVNIYEVVSDLQRLPSDSVPFWVRYHRESSHGQHKGRGYGS